MRKVPGTGAYKRNDSFMQAERYGVFVSVFLVICELNERRVANVEFRSQHAVLPGHGEMRTHPLTERRAHTHTHTDSVERPKSPSSNTHMFIGTFDLIDETSLCRDIFG